MKKEFWKKQALIAYYVLWVVCGLYFLGHGIGESISASSAANRITYARYSAITTQQIEAEFTKVRKIANGPMFNDAVLYFQLAGELDDVEKSSRRMENQDPANAPIYRWAVIQSRTMLMDLHMKFDIDGIRDQFDRESKKYITKHPITIAEAPTNYTKVFALVPWAYLAFVLFTFGSNCILLSRNGCSVWMEMRDNIQFWYYPFIFPYGLFKYPHDVHPGEQIARAYRLMLRVASLVIGTAITACAQVGTMAKKVEPKANDGQTTEDPYRLDISTRTKSQYLGSFVADIFYDGWVQQTSMTLSFPGVKNSVVKGLSLNVWNSAAPNNRPFGSGFASELDLSAGWSGKIRGINLNVGVTYLDVYPLVMLPRGDVVNASITLSKTMKAGKQLTVEPYLFNVVAGPVRGKVPNGGWIMQAGATLKWKPKRWLTFTTNPHAIHDSGAFGEKEGYLFGGNVDAGVKISKHITLHPLEIGTGLPIKIKDQRRNRIVYGFGLDFSFGF
jgi:hypothetical protein